MQHTCQQRLDGRVALLQLAQLAIGVEDPLRKFLVLADGFSQPICGMVQMLFVNTHRWRAVFAPMEKHPQQGRHENNKEPNGPAARAPCVRA